MNSNHGMRSRRVWLLLAALVGALLPAVPAQAAGDVLTIVHVAVRQGDGAIYQGPCGEVAVIDVPLHRHADMASALDNHAGTRTVAWANVSRYHADHVGGFVALAGLPGVDIATVYDRGGDSDAYGSETYGAYYDWATGPAVTREAVDIGDVLTLCSGSQQVSFEVVSVGRNGTAADGMSVSNEDDHSVCLLITFRDFSSATCGDLSGVDTGDRTDMESVVATEFGQVHVAKVGHHGSPNSSNTTYTTTLDPSVAVISVGANGHGHPAASVVANWDAVGADVYQTHNGGPAASGGNELEHGDIRITTDGTSGFTVIPSRGSARAYGLDGTAGGGPGDGERPVGRLAGGDRIATAVALSQRGWPDGADTVLLATAGNFPDALAAGALAAKLDAPILLTPTGSVADVLSDELARLSPDEVLILGGTAAVGAAVETTLRGEGYEVDRVAGVDRFDTAAQIAERAGAPSGSYALASGVNFPDALSAGSLSASPHRLPTLLSRRDVLPQKTADAIVGLGLSSNDTQAHVIGGTAAISNHVTSILGGSVERLSGPSRFETSQAVVEAALDRFDATPRPLLVATGTNFPDALAAGALAAKIGGPLLLVPTGDLPDNLASFIRTNRSRFDKSFVIGGAAAVSGQVRNQVERVLNGLSKNPPEPDPEPDPDPEPGCVDLNTASFEDLQQIIHIGPDRAQQIIDMRPWTSVDDLININGIGPARLQDIKDQGLACVT